jgi:hypothetical protein
MGCFFILGGGETMNQLMKKMVSLGLAGAMTLGMSACGGSSDSNANNSDKV